jgi:hypothetical protein
MGPGRVPISDFSKVGPPKQAGVHFQVARLFRVLLKGRGVTGELEY